MPLSQYKHLERHSTYICAVTCPVCGKRGCLIQSTCYNPDTDTTYNMGFRVNHKAYDPDKDQELKDAGMKWTERIKHSGKHLKACSLTNDMVVALQVTRS
jgi:hypothetical protein